MARLLLVCNHAWNLANFRMALARHLQARGHEVIFAAQRDGAEAQFAAAGVPFVHWQLASDGVNPLTEWSSIKQLASIYAEVRPDLALHYTIKAVIYGGLAARWTKVPYLSFITGLGSNFINDGLVARFARLLYRLVLRRGRAVVFLNADDEREFARLGLLVGSKPVLLPGEGIDVDHFALHDAPTLDGRLRVLFIGRLLVDKGVREYFEAAKRVCAQRRDIVFQILGRVGAENPTAIDRNELERWTTPGYVEYLGETEDVRPLIAASDVVVLPSYREGMPRVLLEAASMGRPVIATDVPGCRAVVRAGSTGMLVPARDAQALAQAVLAFAELTPAERRLMGVEGRKFVSTTYSNAQVFATYDTLLCATRSRPHSGTS